MCTEKSGFQLNGVLQKRSGFQLNISSLHPKWKSNIWNGETKFGNKTLRHWDRLIFRDFVLNRDLLNSKRKAIRMAYATQGITNCDVLYLLSRFFCLSRAAMSSCIHSTTLCEKAVPYVVRLFVYLKASTWSTMHFFAPSSSEARFWCLWRYRQLFWSHATQSSWHCKTHLLLISNSTLSPTLWRSLLPQELRWLQCQQSQRSLRGADWHPSICRNAKPGELSIHHTVRDVSRINRGVGDFPIEVSDPIHFQDSLILLL